jgi:prepilin-type processing-associated H-X9-DG protein
MIKLGSYRSPSSLVYMGDGMGRNISSEYCASPDKVRQVFAERHSGYFNLLYLDGHFGRRRAMDFSELYEDCLIQRVNEYGAPL